MNTRLIGWTMLLYFVGGLLYLMAPVFAQPRCNRWARGLLLGGWLLHTLSLTWRWIESYQIGIGHAPLSNFYESLIFFSWSLVAVIFFGFRRQARDYLGALTATAACLLLAYASFGGHSMDIMPLVPALKSNWLVIHVITCFLGYAAFTLAFGAALLYLFQQRQPVAGGAPPRFEIKELDQLIYRATLVGFFLLTLGILTGAVWAESAWGSYWSWDPKETWALIVWLNYAAWLHMRLMKGLRGTVAAWWALVGLAVTTFAFLGVNMFLSGLHSYGEL